MSPSIKRMAIPIAAPAIVVAFILANIALTLSSESARSQVDARTEALGELIEIDAALLHGRVASGSNGAGERFAQETERPMRRLREWARRIPSLELAMPNLQLALGTVESALSPTGGGIDSGAVVTLDLGAGTMSGDLNQIRAAEAQIASLGADLRSELSDTSVLLGTHWQIQHVITFGSCLLALLYVRLLDRNRHHLAAIQRVSAALEDASAAKSRFLAHMSHELRTPLNSVIGFATVLLRERRGPGTPASNREQETDYIERIARNGRHLLGLINQVLDFSRIEAGSAEVEIQSIDPGILIQEVMDGFMPQAEEAGIRLVSEIPNGLAPLETDPGQMRQILINLVGNAVKFTQEGSVTIKAESDPESAALTSIAVTDTGPGIAEDRLQTIFEAFKQIDTSAARTHEGTGLGLSISRSLAAGLGWNLHVTSREGEGSTFSVLL